MTPDSLRETALEVANSRTLQAALDALVVGLARSGDVALARIWLIDDDDRTRPVPPEPPGRCLKLCASRGSSRLAPQETWSRVDGEFSRVDLNEERKIGYAASQSKPVLIADITTDQKWVAKPQWIAEEGIRSFAAQPLVYGGESLGSVGVFSRQTLSEIELGWLRTFADRAAVSIVNARAFDEIDALRQKLEAERDYLRAEVKDAHAFGDVVGSSPALCEILEQLQMVAPTDSSVLINGESGTGKELIAVAVHEQSPRKDKALVRVNCASVPRELFESEFFGHVKGSFSGAVRSRAGRFELADGGTLFLDEVGEIPLEQQGKLLRVLQEGTFERVGDEHTVRVDVRVVAATNRDLAQEVEAGRFRSDLFYRLNVFPILLPPLRDRGQDIATLAQHFLDRLTKKMNRPRLKLESSHVEALLAYRWPGNIRELQNVMERAVIMSKQGKLNLAGLVPASSSAPASVPSASSNSPATTPAPRAAGEAGASIAGANTTGVLTDAQMEEVERANLVRALQQTAGKVSGEGGAADVLGTKASTLASRIRKFQISKAEYLD